MSSDEEDQDHDRLRALLVENQFLKKRSERAENEAETAKNELDQLKAQQAREVGKLREEIEKLTKKLKREEEMRVATDAAFKLETKRLRESNKKLRRSVSTDRSSMIDRTVERTSLPVVSPIIPPVPILPLVPTERPKPIETKKPKPVSKPFMPLSMIEKKKEVEIKKPKKQPPRKNSLEEIVIPQPKKCVEALTPEEAKLGCLRKF